MKKYFLSEEKNIKFLRNQFNREIKEREIIKTRKHYLDSFEEFYYIKNGPIIINGFDLPVEFSDFMKKVINPNPFEVIIFPINAPLYIPTAYIPNNEYNIMNIDDYLNSKRSADVILA